MSSQITTGSFLSAGVPYFIPLEQQVNWFKITNQTKMASYTSGRITQAEWNNYMSNGIAIVDAPTTNTIASTVVRTQLAQNGITVVNYNTPQTNTPTAISSFVPGTTTVFTCGGAHGLIVGDIVRIYDMTSAPELGGLAMTVTATGGGGTTFTTLLNSSNSVTSVGNVVKIGSYGLPPSSLYYPQLRVIAAITKANPMVVTTLVQQNYQVGDVVRFYIPQQPTNNTGTNGFGMPQLNSTYTGLPFQATVSAVNNAVGTQTVTFANVNSTNFTTFAFPGTGFYPSSFPQMIPQGEGNTNNFANVTPTPLPYGNQNILGFATQNIGANGVLIGAGDGTAASTTGGIIDTAANETFTWICETSLQTFP